MRDLVARAPGRINLIGEHSDYCGLPVFPMAIQRGVRVRGQPRVDRLIRIVNADPRFPARSFTLDASLPPEEAGDWGNYVRAAAQAVVRRYGDLHGADLQVTSDLPVAAGLSSSSALVVAVAVALLACNGTAFDSLDLASVLAEGERYVGTAGGGMDQAIALGARAGHAARIDFGPVRLTYVPVPAHWRFVVAWSLVGAAKSGGARRAYNARAQETAVAREAVARHLKVPDAATYADLLAARPVDELLDAAATLEPLLRRRYRHVVTEGARVRDAERTMRGEDLQRFGALMDASHASLRDDYEVSIPELNRLVEITREAGAAGARLTGAGFGGCVVALAAADTVERVLSQLRERFYLEKGVHQASDALFVAEPSAGASVDPSS